MIARQQGKDNEVDLVRGTILVGHIFNTGAPGKPLEPQVYTVDYQKRVTVSTYEEAAEWILQQLQGD